MSVLAVAYHLCDLVSGEILADLPLSGDEEVQNTCAREDTTTFTLNVFDLAIYTPGKPVTWQQTLQPGKTMIVQTLDDGTGPTPVQGWVVTDATVGASTVPIPCATLEHCLAETYLDTDVDGTFDESIMTWSVLDAADVEGKWGFTVAVTPAGRTGDADYSADEDRTVLDILTERMAGTGAEWRIVLDWNDDHSGFTKTIEVAGHIGIDRPDAVFDLNSEQRGTIESYTRTTSAGPTRIIGGTEGSGSSRITTDPITANELIAAGWPLREKRVTYTDLTDVEDVEAALTQRTRAQLDSTKTGVVVWTIVGNDDAPRPGTGFNPGDTVYVDIDPQIPTDPAGGTAAMRVLGYRLNTTSLRVTPILWEDTDG